MLGGLDASLLDDWGAGSSADGAVSRLEVDALLLETVRASFSRAVLDLRCILEERSGMCVSEGLAYDAWRAELAVFDAPGDMVSGHAPLWWARPIPDFTDKMHFELADVSRQVEASHGKGCVPTSEEVGVLNLSPHAARGLSAVIDVMQAQLLRRGRIEGDLANAKPGMPPVSMSALRELRSRVVSVGGDPWVCIACP